MNSKKKSTQHNKLVYEFMTLAIEGGQWMIRIEPRSSSSRLSSEVRMWRTQHLRLFLWADSSASNLAASMTSWRKKESHQAPSGKRDGSIERCQFIALLQTHHAQITMLRTSMLLYLRKPLLSSLTRIPPRNRTHPTLARLLSTTNALAHQPAAGTDSATGASPTATSLDEMPPDLVHELRSSRPLPIRLEFTRGIVTSEMLEKMDVGLKKHRVPTTFSDMLAYYTVKLLRRLPDAYFRNNHYMRVVMLVSLVQLFLIYLVVCFSWRVF